MGTAAMLAVAVVSTYFLANVIRTPSKRKKAEKEERKDENTLERAAQIRK